MNSNYFIGDVPYSDNASRFARAYSRKYHLDSLSNVDPWAAIRIPKKLPPRRPVGIRLILSSDEQPASGRGALFPVLYPTIAPRKQKMNEGKSN